MAFLGRLAFFCGVLRGDTRGVSGTLSGVDAVDFFNPIFFSPGIRFFSI